MLKFLDSDQQDFGAIVNKVQQTPLRTSHDGKLGGAYSALIYVKNDDPTLYYTNVTLVPSSADYDDIVGEWGETGFSLKVLYGEREPTEIEWDQVKSGETIDLPDIGDTEAADTANLYPVWVRAYVPGKTTAQIKESVSLRVLYNPRQVGS